MSYASRIILGFGVAGAWILGFCVVSQAADATALAKKAHDILKANCYRCHGQEGTVEGGLNYVLDVKTLVACKKVIPGDAGKSRLFKRVTSEDNPMPPEEEKVRPGKHDIALLKQWIEAGAPEAQAAPAPRAFLAEADILRAIADDLRALDERQQRFTRYFTISHLANAGLSEDELQTYRHGLSKLVNSLSWEPDIVVPRFIDPAKTIYRIDLRDYKWNATVWKRMLDVYPYGVLSNHPAARAISTATECELPYVRADWFVFAASRPPLYHDILQLPKTDVELERELKIDVATNLQEERVARAAFNGSGVSRNNRLIERHKTGYGAYWKSYDFAGNSGRQNLFAHPLGPGPDENTFQQDGGEIIFNLPNGLQAYLLVDGKGRRIDEGPTKIVSVKNKPDPTVINGVSCMSCHARGTIEKADQVRAHAEKNAAAFSEADSRSIRALYPPETEFKALLQKDAERFRRAVEATGAKVGATEPIVALAGRFELELDLPTAAGELGLTPERFLAGLGQSPELSRRLGSLKVEGGTVQRQAFVDLFDDLVRAFRLGTALQPLNKAIATATETLRTDPKNATAYFERANAQFDKGDYDKAIADYGEAIRFDFRGAEAYRNRGMAHANKGDYDRAVADYSHALRIEPSHAETYHNRGLAHAKQQAPAEALADLTEGIRLDPKDASLFSDRGFLHVQQRQYDKAVADFTEALRLNPRSVGTYQRRAEAYGLKGEHEKAVADYGQVVRLSPDNARMLNELAWLLATCSEARVRDGKQAVVHATRACELSAWKEPGFLDTLAAAHAECGRFTDAVQWVKKALELAPEGDRETFRARLQLYEAGKPYHEAKAREAATR